MKYFQPCFNALVGVNIGHLVLYKPVIELNALQIASEYENVDLAGKSYHTNLNALKHRR